MPDVPYQQAVKKWATDSLDTSVSARPADTKSTVDAPSAPPADAHYFKLDEISVDQPEVRAVHSESPDQHVVDHGTQPDQDYAALNMPERARVSGIDIFRLGHAPDYQPTFLDKIVDFLAALLKKLEHFLIDKLRTRFERKKYRLRRIKQDETETMQMATSPLDDPEVLPGEKIKWQARGKRLIHR